MKKFSKLQIQFQDESEKMDLYTLIYSKIKSLKKQLLGNEFLNKLFGNRFRKAVDMRLFMQWVQMNKICAKFAEKLVFDAENEELKAIVNWLQSEISMKKDYFINQLEKYVK